MKRKIKGFTVLLLTCSLLINGCGKKPLDAPMLLEPEATNESYRPVSYGNVSSVDLVFGVVVPKDYAHFWMTNADIKEIFVEIGDYVEAGDILASADIDVANANIKELSQALSTENTTRNLQYQIYQKKREELGYKAMGLEAIGDTEGAQAIYKEIAILDENDSYDSKLHDFRVKSINESIAKQNEIVSDGTLIARKSGYVTYVRDISDSVSVTNTENVVVISDYDDRYIELDISGSTADYYERHYQSSYTIYGDNTYNLKEYKYSAKENLRFAGNDAFPNLRFLFEDGSALPEVGTMLPVFLQVFASNNVLTVGKDSVYKDENGNFVYVRENGERIIRYVELGISDRFNYEVLDGLSEGEWVYYSSSSIPPTDYIETEAKLSDYTASMTSKGVNIIDKSTKVYFSEYEGIVMLDEYVSDGDKVEKGDLIMKVKTDEGSAHLAEMRLSITNFEESHNAVIQGYDEQIAAINNEILSIQSAETAPEEETATDTDVKEPTDPYLVNELYLQIDQINLMKEIENVNYNNQIAAMKAEYDKVSCNNDGNGIISIYAKESGNLDSFRLKNSSKLSYGDKMFNIEVDVPKKLLVKTDGKLTLNQEVFFKMGDGQEYFGRVVGYTGDTADNAKMYVSTIDDGVYITYSTTQKSKGYYIEVTDKGIFDNDSKSEVSFYTEKINDSIVLPNTAVFIETDEQSGNASPYVWKIIDGEFVKQYVTAIKNVTKADTKWCVLEGVKPGDVVAEAIIRMEE